MNDPVGSGSDMPQEKCNSLELARLYVGLTRALHEVLCPGSSLADFDLEMLIVLLCVFIGVAEGTATTPTKISSHSGLPRTSVYRRLKQLLKCKKIVKVGRNYRLADYLKIPDDHGPVAGTLRAFLK